MQLNFSGNIMGLEAGIEILGHELGFETCKKGARIRVENTGTGIEVVFENGAGTIRYKDKIHFFRALGLLIEELRNRSSFEILEQPQFTMNGTMIDVSRNGVMKVESIKEFLRKMALMGLNMMMLYTEDTYTIESKPYFGYMRGRYSFGELKDCDDYADIFGIEMIPCIQTLGHLEQALKWEAASEVRDTGSILLAGSEKTYAFIEEMIKTASTPFRSKRIHIGMDEAHELGLGKYLHLNGFKRRFDIMTEHLKRVMEITRKLELKPMIWSDMYFKLASKDGFYYDLDAVIPEDVIENTPKDVRLVYWDYYHDTEEHYAEFIRRHGRFEAKTIFAGGVFTWVGFCTWYTNTFITNNASLAACKKEGIKEVFLTLWGDNGMENNYFSALLALQLYAEHGYAKDLSMDKLKKRFKFCTGADADAFMDLKYLDQIPGVPEDKYCEYNPSKYLLWQDVLIGLFDKHIEGIDTAGYYAGMAKKYREHMEQNKKWGFVFDVPCKLCEVLELKADLGLKIKACYDKEDRAALGDIVERVIPELRHRLEELRSAHREQWFRTYKPFGWEVLDVRYGGVLSRLDTTIKRLKDYIQGNIAVIEELEEERLFFDGKCEHRENRLTYCNSYSRIISGSSIV